MRPRHGWALALGFLVATAASGQKHPNHEIGTSAPEKLYDFGGLDSVNVSNGNLSVRIDIGGSAVNGGLAYQLVAFYNSTVWDFLTVFAPEPAPGEFVTQAFPSRFSNAGLGWRVSLGELYDPEEVENETEFDDGIGHYLYVAEDGQQTILYQTLHAGDSNGTSSDPEYFREYSRNSTYARLLQVSLTVKEIELGSGIIKRFERASFTPQPNVEPPPFKLTQIRDRFGNALEVTQTDTLWTLSDGHRTHEIEFQSLGGYKVVKEVRLAAFQLASAPPIEVAVFPFTYTLTAIPRSCKDNDDNLEFGETSPTVTVPLLRSIALPASGGSFAMDGATDYNLACTDGIADLPGTLARLRLPTGGRLEWTYQEYGFPQGGEATPPGISWTSNAGIATRKRLPASGGCVDPQGNCTWTHTRGAVSGETWQRYVDVTTPLGHTTRNYFYFLPNREHDDWSGWEYGLPIRPAQTSGGMMLSQEIYDGDVAAANKRREVYLLYERDQIPVGAFGSEASAPNWYDINRRVRSTRTRHFDETGAFLNYVDMVNDDFDGLGHYRKSTTSGTVPGGATRTVTTRFLPDLGTYAIGATNAPLPAHDFTMLDAEEPWVLGTYERVHTVEGAEAAVVELSFDPETGFLERRRTWRDGSTNPDADTRSPEDVVVRFTADAHGNVGREDHYGGDDEGPSDPGLGTGALSALSLPDALADSSLAHTYSAGALATSEYRVSAAPGAASVGWKLVDRDIDAASGLVKVSRDAAGVSTSYEYDALGRLTWAKPENVTGSAAGTQAWTQHGYVAASGGNPARVDTYSRGDGSASGPLLTQRKVLFDPFGRIAEEQELLGAGNWAIRKTVTLASGERASLSSWGSSVDKTEYSEYDPFGRPRLIRPADGANHDVDLSYLGSSVVERTIRTGTCWDGFTVSEKPVTTVERYDLHGRLFQVEEPTGLGTLCAGGSPTTTTTTYGYDIGNRLASVSTLAQVRQFEYDNRGFLRWENHPEKTANVLGQGHDVDYLAYDALGRAGRKVDGASDLRFTYDTGARLTKVAEQPAGGGLRTLKEWAFDEDHGAPSGQVNKPNGKMTTADRYHYPAAIPGLTARIRETYLYAGRGGRASKRTTQRALNGQNCLISSCFTFELDQSYNQLGMVSSIDYPDSIAPYVMANDDRTVTFQYSNGHLSRVAPFTAFGAGGVDIRQYSNRMLEKVRHSNGVDDVHARDADSVGRPASISTTGVDGGNNWSSGSYRYDGAGNVVQIGADDFQYDPAGRIVRGHAAASFQTYTYDPHGNLTAVAGTNGRTIGTSATTNRLTGHTYDAEGNLVTWMGTHVYGYDALNLMESYAYPTADPTQHWVYLYTADDERVLAIDLVRGGGTWTLRGLDGKPLRQYRDNPALLFRDDFDAGSTDRWSVDGQAPVDAEGRPLEREDHVWRNGLLLAAVDDWENERHFHLDHLGTPRLITGGDGGSLARHDYLPYGEEVGGATTDAKLKFTGHERDFNDPSSGADELDYMVARFYNPLTARFTSTDSVPPMRMAMAQPQMWNLYSYTGGNPIRFVDPTGLSIEVPDDYTEELALLRDTLLAVGAEAIANVLKVINVGGTNQIAPVDPGLIDKSNSTGSLIAGLINDSQNSVSLDVTSGKVGSGGATATRASDNRFAVKINPAEVRQTMVFARPWSGSFAGRNVIGIMTPSPTLVHEFGHVQAHIFGAPLNAPDAMYRPGFTQNSIQAIAYENQHRYMLKGPENFYRMQGHSSYSGN